MTKFLLGFFSFGWLRGLDFLPPLLLRFLLGSLFWVSGKNKLGLFTADDSLWYKPWTWVNLDNPAYNETVTSLSNLPFVGEGLASLFSLSIGWLEVLGAFLLVIGFAVRWVSLPLLVLLALSAIVVLNGENIGAAIKGLFLTHGYTDMSDSSFSKVAIYLVMLLSLFFMGAGRFFSVDYWLYRRLNKKLIASETIRNGATKVESTKEDPFDLDNTTD